MQTEKRDEEKLKKGIEGWHQDRTRLEQRVSTRYLVHSAADAGPLGVALAHHGLGPLPGLLLEVGLLLRGRHVLELPLLQRRLGLGHPSVQDLGPGLELELYT